MAGPDLSVITAVVDFGSVVGAVLGVAAALIVAFVAQKGARMVLDAVRGGSMVSPERYYVGNDGESWTETGLQDAWNSMDHAEQNAWGSSSNFLENFTEVDKNGRVLK